VRYGVSGPTGSLIEEDAAKEVLLEKLITGAGPYEENVHRLPPM